MPDLSTSFPADSIAPAFARRLVDDFLAPECPPELAQDAALLASELVTNSVRHSGLTESDSIGLDMDLTPERVRVAISDEGAGFDLPAPAPRGIGGWGLVLVERLSDRWGAVRDKPNSVWFELDR